MKSTAESPVKLPYTSSLSIQKLHEYVYYWNNERISLKLKGMSPVQYRTHHILLEQRENFSQTKRNESGTIPNSSPNNLIKFLSNLWGSLQTFSLSEKQLLSETTYRLIPIFYKEFKVNIRDLETIQQILSKCLSLLKNNET